VTVLLPVTGLVVVIVVTPDALVVATEWDTGGADWPAAVTADVPCTPDPLLVATEREAVGARWLAAVPALAARLCGAPAPAAGLAGAPAAGMAVAPATGTLGVTAAGTAPRASATTAAPVPTISAAADQFDIRRAWPMPSRRVPRGRSQSPLSQSPEFSRRPCSGPPRPGSGTRPAG
jgi:hypothetical protein